jgi:hypothetical protein
MTNSSSKQMVVLMLHSSSRAPIANGRCRKMTTLTHCSLQHQNLVVVVAVVAVALSLRYKLLQQLLLLSLQKQVAAVLGVLSGLAQQQQPLLAAVLASANSSSSYSSRGNQPCPLAALY